MIWTLFSGLLPSALMLGGIGLAGAVIYLGLYRQKRSGKRPPFTKAFLRSPGETLRRQLDENTLDMTAYMMLATLMPVLLFAMEAAQAMFGRPPSMSHALTTILIGVVVEGYVFYRLYRVLAARNPLRLGWEGEIAVGEELNQLMLQGLRVFHDLPAGKGFNIDHVVIGPRGVLAVETKARSKGFPGQGSGAVKVRYDGKSLVFPDHRDSSALEQAKRQAHWLAKWLASATGETVPVFPVIVLPGWYVERTAPSRSVFVIGTGEIQKECRRLGNARLTPEQIQRVAHQVEQRCRTVEPWIPRLGKEAPAPT
jgi:hypothetical protein